METFLILCFLFVILCVASGLSKHCIVLALLLVGGCASTTGHLQLATAHQFPGMGPEQVTVSQVSRSVTQVRWSAQTPQGPVQCWADDMMRRVVCRP